MRGGGLGQRVRPVDAELQLTGGDPVEHVAGAPEELLTGGDVVAEARASAVERALAVEDVEINGGHGAARLSEEGERTAGTERVEALLEGGPGYGVVDDVDAASAGEALHFDVELLPGVEDDLVGSVLARDPSLLLCGGGAEDAGAEHFGHLDDESAGPARGGVDQARVAGLEGEGGVGQVVGGHALEHGSSSGLEIDAVGELDEHRGG